jgi:hypothetical protein
MRRGCITIDEIKCDNCKKTVEHGERYLLIEDPKDETNKKRYCVECCLKKKYASYVTEKGEKVLTFFTEETLAPKAAE